MGLFDVNGIRTESNKEVFDFAKQVVNSNKAISCSVSERFITGTYNFNPGSEFKYCYTSKEFVYGGDYSHELEKAFSSIKRLK